MPQPQRLTMVRALVMFEMSDGQLVTIGYDPPETASIDSRVEMDQPGAPGRTSVTVDGIPAFMRQATTGEAALMPRRAITAPGVRLPGRGDGDQG